jgi:hypothetical protein
MMVTMTRDVAAVRAAHHYAHLSAHLAAHLSGRAQVSTHGA